MFKKSTLLQWSGKFFYVYCLLIKNRSCLTTNIEIIIIVIIIMMIIIFFSYEIKEIVHHTSIPKAVEK